MLAEKKYYNWIDYAKFLSIFLVVFFHAPPEIDGYAGTFLNLIRMPMFFFLSGLLFKQEKYTLFWEFIKHRSRQLLIPYFCFFALFYTYWLIYGKYHGDQDDLAVPFYQPTIEYLLGVPNLVCKPLWFVPCLFVIQCLFFVLFKRIERKYGVFLLILFPLIPHTVDISNYPFSLSSVCHGIAFYGIASFFRKEIIHFVNKKSMLKTFYLISSLIVYFILVYLIEKVNVSIGLVLLKIPASFLIIIAILIIMNYLSEVFGKQIFINRLSSNAIIILAFHTYSIIALQRILTIIFENHQHFFQNQIFIYKFSIAVISMISMIIPIWFINKYTPFVLGKIK